MMRIQLPTGKTAVVDTAWWLGLTDDEQRAFYERDYGIEADPLNADLPSAEQELDLDSE